MRTSTRRKKNSIIIDHFQFEADSLLCLVRAIREQRAKRNIRGPVWWWCFFFSSWSFFSIRTSWNTLSLSISSVDGGLASRDPPSLSTINTSLACGRESSSTNNTAHHRPQRFDKANDGSMSKPRDCRHWTSATISSSHQVLSITWLYLSRSRSRSARVCTHMRRKRFLRG